MNCRSSPQFPGPDITVTCLGAHAGAHVGQRQGTDPAHGLSLAPRVPDRMGRNAPKPTRTPAQTAASAPRYCPLPLSSLKHIPHSGLRAFALLQSHLEGHVLRAMAAARDPHLLSHLEGCRRSGREGVSYSRLLRNKLDNLLPSSYT